MDADKAREIYESIVRRRKDPALLTLAGHGLVRAQVFPIQPGETRRVALRYTQLLTRQGDALRLRYALGLRGSDSATELRIEIARGDLYGTPYSPTHTIDSRTEGGRLDITVSPGNAGDVELFLPLRRPVAGATLLSHAAGGEDGYFMLLLAPGPAGRAQAVPRDLTLVVDVSGSMSGTKLEQAKAALQQALGTLGSNDRFRVIAFSGAVRSFRDEPVRRPTPISPTRANSWTVWPRRAAPTSPARSRPRSTSPVTPSVSRRSFWSAMGCPRWASRPPTASPLSAAARIGRARIFPVGVGHDVNTYLLDRLAAEGRGAVEYVPPGASVESAVGVILSKLRHPALVDLRIAESPVELVAPQPARLPDLFYGEELVVFGRYREGGSGHLVVTGTRNGARERVETQATFASSESGNAFIPRLWAARRIGELTRLIRVEGPSPVLIEEMRDLALRFGILTEYTSYLVQEPERLANTPAPMPRLESAREQTGAAAFDRARRSAKFAGDKDFTRCGRGRGRGGRRHGAGSGGPAAKQVGGRMSSSGIRSGLTSGTPIGSLSPPSPPSVLHISPWCECCRS